MKGYAVSKRFERLEYRVAKTEEKIDLLVKTSLPSQGIFYDGQFFDAYALVCDLIQSAKKRIVVIDNYADYSVLRQLDKRAKGVSATVYTPKYNEVIKDDIKRHNAQYSRIELKFFQRAHDRFLIIDDDVYLIGASLKDMGKRIFGFFKMEEMTAEELLSNLVAKK